MPPDATGANDLIVKTNEGALHGRDLTQAKDFAYSGLKPELTTISLQIELPADCAIGLGDDFLYEAIIRQWKEFKLAERGARSSDAMAAARGLDFLVQVMDQLEALRKPERGQQ